MLYFAVREYVKLCSEAMLILQLSSSRNKITILPIYLKEIFVFHITNLIN
jgi:hypothetical protein